MRAPVAPSGCPREMPPPFGLTSAQRSSSRVSRGSERRTTRIGPSIALELHGISHVLSCGCTSSTDAIGYGAALIRAGEYDVLLSGGADGCVVGR